jgi:hypothetical protein
LAAPRLIRLKLQPMAFGRVAQLQFKMMCERPPAAFGGSPPHGGGEYVISRSERGGRSHIILKLELVAMICRRSAAE